jgi:hypothetical protein
MPLLKELGSLGGTWLSRCYAGIRQVLPGSQSRRWPEAQRRGQILQSQAPYGKNAPESAICGVLPNRKTTTGSVLWLVPISNPRSAPRRASRSNNLRTPCPILKGLCIPAQGRPVVGQIGDGPTLGNRAKSSSTLKAVAPTRKAHWPGAPASEVPTESKLNRLLPVQRSGKVGRIILTPPVA